MRLKSFRIKNYRSIIDSCDVTLSDNDNVMILVGQNESGKSAVLKALNDFSCQSSQLDSKPFSIEGSPIQSVSYIYKLEQEDNLEQIVESFKGYLRQDDRFNYQVNYDEDRLKVIREFRIIITNEGDSIKLAIDDETFDLFRSSFSFSSERGIEEIEIPEEYNSDAAASFLTHAPMIVLLEGFCDILPNQISISVLRNQQQDIEGYRAVKNVEAILGINFIELDEEDDGVRWARLEERMESLSNDFKNSWGQRIYGDNEISIKCYFSGGDSDNSHIRFYIETKNRQRLTPKQRSLGFIWFLSLWLELRGRNNWGKDLILLLDEPDQHLHIKAQKDMLRFINELAKRTDTKQRNQIIYATHSPYLIERDFLSRVKLVINDKKEGTKLEDITTDKINTKNARDALQPIADAIGWGVGEFSTLARKNVILEGISDFYYFSAMRRILKREEDYVFIPGLGVGEIKNLISMCIGYGLSWVAVIDDDDPEKKGGGSKRAFDKVKKYIFDGDQAKTEEKVYILKGISGIEKMFSDKDLHLIGLKIQKHPNQENSIGGERKHLFAKIFFERVESGEIKEEDLSTKVKGNFREAFDFIDRGFSKSE